MRVFLSSTWNDLQPEREAILAVLHSMREIRGVGMEYFGAQPENVRKKSLQELDGCQLYVGVLAGSYGSGVTELEYERARELQIPCLVYEYVKEEAAVARDEDDPRYSAFVRKLRQNHTVVSFSGVDDLTRQIAVDLGNWLAEPLPLQLEELRPALSLLIADFGRELAREQDLPLGLQGSPEDSPVPLDAGELLGTPIRENLRRPPGESKPEVLGDLVGGSLYRRVVLTGEPGAGKTALLKRLVLYEAERLLAGEPAARLPIYIPLAHYRESQTLEELIAEFLQGFAPRLEVSRLRPWLAEGKVLLLLDGLNEVPLSAYGSCRREIERSMQLFPAASFLITELPTYDGALPASVFRLEDWSLERIGRYVRWAMPRLGSRRDPEMLLERIREDVGLAHMVATPLPLGILTGIYSDDGSVAVHRAALYRSFVDRLLARDRGRLADSVPTPVKLAVLRALAFEMHASDRTSAPESSIVEICRRNLGEREAPAPQAVFESLVRGRWLQESGSRSWRFRFLPLASFFVAQNLEERWEAGDLLGEIITDGRFEEEVVLVASLLERPQPFLDQVSRLAGVQLAARCLIGAPQAPGRERILHQLARELSSHVELRRRHAASKFIFLRAIEAVPALIEALADESGAVRWNAAKAIETTLPRAAADEVLIGALAQASEAARRNLCQALGRSDTRPAAAALLGELESGSDLVWRTAGEALARSRDPSAMELLARVAGSEGGTPDLLRARALWAIGRQEPERFRDLARSCLDHPSRSVQDAARVVLGRSGDAAVIAAAIRVLREGPEADRQREIRNLEDMGAPAIAALDALWELLLGGDRELRPLLLRALRALHGPRVLERAAQELSSSEPARRRTALSVLGHVDDDRGIPSLVEALRDPDPEAARTAADQLRRFGDRAIPELETALANAAHAAEAAWLLAVLSALHAVGSRRALQLLAPSLADPREEVAQAALRHFKNADPQQVRLILREIRPAPRTPAGLLWEKMERSRLFWLALDFRRSQDSGLWRELTEAAAEAIPVLRSSALWALGETRSPQAEPLLRRAAEEDADPGVRAAAVGALVQLALPLPESLVESFATWALNPAEEEEVRVASLDALACCGGEPERLLLLGIDESANPAILQRALNAAASIDRRRYEGNAAAVPLPPPWKLPLLVEGFKSRKRRRQERRLAIEEIARSGLPAARGHLIEALGDSDLEVRRIAVTHLLPRPEEAAVPALAKFFLVPDLGLRRAAILALRAIGTDAAIRALGWVAKDPQPVLRQLVLDTLAPMAAEPAAFEALARFLGSADSRRAVEALGGVDPARLTEDHRAVLERCLRNRDLRVRCEMLEILAHLRLDPVLSSVHGLTRDRDLSIRRGALRVLAARPAPADLPAVREALGDVSVPVRQEAVRILLQLDGDAASELLLEAASDPEPGVAGTILSAGAIGPPERLETLLHRLLLHPAARVRFAALDILAGQSEPLAVAALASLLKDRDTTPAVRLRAIEVAGRIGARALAPLLVEALKTPREAVQKSAVEALGRLAEPAAAFPLAQLAKRTPLPELQREILASLAKIPSPDSSAFLLRAALAHGSDADLRRRVEEAIAGDGSWIPDEELLSLLQDPLAPVRAAGARLVARRHLEAAVQPLSLLIRDDRDLRITAVSALGEIGSEAAGAVLCDAVRAHDPELSESAVRALGALGSTAPPVVNQLCWALARGGERYEGCRQAAVAALITLGSNSSEAAVPQLLRLLGAPNPYVQQAACRVLGGLRAEAAARPLVAILKDRTANSYTRLAAGEALLQTASEEVLGELFGALEAEEPRIRAMVVQVLGELRAAAATHAIGERLSDEPAIRASAVEALGRIGTPEALQWLGFAALDPVPPIREQVLRQLAEIPSEHPGAGAAAAGLTLLLDDPRLRRQAAEALAANRHERSIEGLLQCLEYADPAVRALAAKALGERPAVPHLSVLLDATVDVVPAVRAEAQAAVGKLLDQLLESAVRRILREEKKFPPGKYLFYWRETREEVMPLLAEAGGEWVAKTCLRALAPRRPSRSRPPKKTDFGPYLRLLGWVAGELEEDLADQVEAALLRAVGHPNWRVRLCAILAAGDAGLRRAIPHALAFAASGDALEQQAAIRVLVELSRREPVPEAVTALRSLAGPGLAVDTRYSAIRAFEEVRLRDRDARRIALEAIEDPETKIQEAGLIALGHCGTEEDAFLLTEYLSSPAPAMRRAAAKSLRKICQREREAVTPNRELSELLRDPVQTVVEAAIEACRELGIVEAVEALVDLALSTPNPDLFELASAALVRLGSPLAVQYLAPLTTQPGRPELEPALTILSRLALPEAQRLLRERLSHRHPGVRAAVLGVLARPASEGDEPLHPAGGAGLRSWSPDLLARFADEDAEVRVRVLELVSNRGLLALFQPDVEELLADPSPAVRAQAARVLGRQADAAVAPRLFAALEGEPTPQVRRALLRALARFGSQQIAERLRQWSRDTDPRTRFLVTTALQAERLRSFAEGTTTHAPLERLEDRNPYIQRAAILQIGQSGRADQAAYLVPFLAGESSILRQAALEALGHLHAPATYGEILRLAGSREWWMRTRVAQALARFADPRSLPVLETMLRADASVAVRHAAAEALATLEHPRALEILGDVLEGSTDPLLARRVALQLGDVPGILASRALARGLRHPDDRVRLSVVQRFAERPAGPDETAELETAFRDENPRVVREAIRAAAAQRVASLLPRLREALGDPDSQVRSAAAQALGDLGARECAPDLIEATRDPERPVAIAAARALGRIRCEEAVDALAEMLEQEEKPLVLAAVEALGWLPVPAAAAALGRVSSHPEVGVRQEVVAALRRLPGELALEPLLTASRDASRFVREDAVEGLAVRGRPEALAGLQQAVHDRNPFVRLAAVNALGELEPGDALPILGQALRDPHPQVRGRAALTLGRLSRTDYGDEISSLLEDLHSNVRSAAILVLSRRAEPIYVALIANQAKTDPSSTVRALALRELRRSPLPGARQALKEIESEEANREALLRSSPVRELSDDLEALARRGVNREDEEELARFTLVLTRAFSLELPALRLRAATLAARWPHPAAFSIYEYAVQDPLPEIRKSAVRALLGLATEPAYELLFARLTAEPSPEVRTTIVEELELEGAPEGVLRLLGKALSDPSRFVIQAALHKIASGRPDKASELLAPLLRHADDFVREAAVNALGELELRELLPQVWRLLTDASAYVRQDAIAVLTRLGTEELALRACSVGLADPNPYVQLASLKGLLALASPGSLARLLDQLDPAARPPALRALVVEGIYRCLKRRGDTAFAEVDWEQVGLRLRVAFSTESHTKVLLRLIEALVLWDSRRGKALISHCIFHQDNAVRRKALQICETAPEDVPKDELLARFSAERRSMPVLVKRDLASFFRRFAPLGFSSLSLELLADNDEFVRVHAALHLARAADPAALQALRGALGDPASMVRDAVSLGLRLRAEPRTFKPPEEDPGLLSGVEGREPASSPAPSPALGQKIGSNRWLERWYGIVTLAEAAEAADAQAIESLVRTFLADENQIVRAEAGRILRRASRQAVREAATTVLKDASVDVQEAQRETLAAMLDELPDRLPVPPSAAPPASLRVI